MPMGIAKVKREELEIKTAKQSLCSLCVHQPQCWR